MKILFLTSAFNGLAQRAWIELDRLNHQVKVVIVTNVEVMEKSVETYFPDLIVAPYLKVRIPESVWKQHLCLVVHPGIRGDRGASSLDWAILNRRKSWGVTILQAAEKMDSGAIWAAKIFPLRRVSKSCLYRHEVTQAAVSALLESIHNLKLGSQSSGHDFGDQVSEVGKWRRRTRQSDYRFGWKDSSEEILDKILAADSDPGVRIKILGHCYFAYGGWREDFLRGAPGTILARRNKAICIATGDGAIWITQLKRDRRGAVKLPATDSLGAAAITIPVSHLDPFNTISDSQSFQEIRVKTRGEVAFIHFDFYNGAMDCDQCNRLRETIAFTKEIKSIKVLVLMGGTDLWCNGIHLNVIENSHDPADYSWKNINAFDDLILEVIESPDHYVIAALQGNAGAGGVPFALAADKVIAREGIVVNPHTRKMGLYGSEYWTYLLPRRIGTEKARLFTEQCLPWGTAVAKEIGLIDEVFTEGSPSFSSQVAKSAAEIVALDYFDKLLKAKQHQRRKDERVKPLAQYREEELIEMWKNFYYNNEDYDGKRFRFVHKIMEDSPKDLDHLKDLYSSRRKIYRRRKSESINYPEKVLKK